ncbi:aldose reductase [Entamoeba histolytica HM-3:IMSS]|uniref:Aldose reductase, putative n=2 Tax=Entamoeba histolytica TaxID=5759 RepID=M2SDV4_ENTHI|nr:aldose reductase, putative [Entamoeba histolytica KU27]EMS15057.1 aldose reductase [Entamoeba histolytica HM-3:IMSS]
MLQHGFFLNNGKFMPAIGLGTWLAAPGEVGKAVTLALENGYRLIDCARFYKNEKEIGEMGIEPFLKNHPREELFVTSKLWMDQVTRIRESCLESIQDLKCKYLDLYLIHWPIALKVDASNPPKPEDFLDMDITEIWQEMEKLVDEGLVKSIGLSNFTIPQIEKIMKMCRIKPVINQVELNVYLQQNKLREVCKSYNIVVEAYRPIGGKPANESDKNCLDDEVVVSLAKKYNKTTAQICLRWLVQNGIIAVPKSTNPNRLLQNYQVFEWSLSNEDMKALEKRNLNKRNVKFENYWNGKTYEEFWGEEQ